MRRCGAGRSWVRSTPLSSPAQAAGNSFLSGGVFSYDGVHLNDIGYAVVANEFIRVINGAGGNLPPVDLGAVLGVTASSADQARASAWRAGAGASAFVFTPEAYANLLAALPTVDRRP